MAVAGSWQKPTTHDSFRGETEAIVVQGIAVDAKALFFLFFFFFLNQDFADFDQFGNLLYCYIAQTIYEPQAEQRHVRGRVRRGRPPLQSKDCHLQV